MSEIIDKPTILPVYPTNPFEDNFKSKWYERYKNDGCTKEQLQRLYNIDKLTEEDFKLITGELPSEKVTPQKGKVSELQDKISILEAENKALLEGQKIQDRTIVENDMRMMDLEWALEDLITSINPTAKINLTEVFTMFGRSATYFNQLKQMIEMENYDSKEDMERILNKYAAGSRPRITQEEYDQLFDLLYPPVYDIPTTIPEV